MFAVGGGQVELYLVAPLDDCGSGQVGGAQLVAGVRRGGRVGGALGGDEAVEFGGVGGGDAAGCCGGAEDDAGAVPRAPLGDVAVRRFGPDWVGARDAVAVTVGDHDGGLGKPVGAAGVVG